MLRVFLNVPPLYLLRQDLTEPAVPRGFALSTSSLSPMLGLRVWLLSLVFLLGCLENKLSFSFLSSKYVADQTISPAQKTLSIGIVEMAQRLRAMTALPEDPGSNSQHPWGSSQQSVIPRFDTEIYAGKIPMHIK